MAKVKVRRLLSNLAFTTGAGSWNLPNTLWWGLKADDGRNG